MSVGYLLDTMVKKTMRKGSKIYEGLVLASMKLHKIALQFWRQEDTAAADLVLHAQV